MGVNTISPRARGISSSTTGALTLRWYSPPLWPCPPSRGGVMSGCESGSDVGRSPPQNEAIGLSAGGGLEGLFGTGNRVCSGSPCKQHRQKELR